MKYAILIYETPDDFATRTAGGSKAEAYRASWGAYAQALGEAKVYAGGKALAPPATGSVVRVRGGKRLVQDGPYADTKEQLGGVIVIEADNLDKALEWAARCPSTATGATEVRPVMELPPEMRNEDEGDAAVEVTHVLLLYGDEAADAGMSPEEQGEQFGAYFAYTKALREAEATAGGEALQPTTTATTVRQKGGKRQVQDGPYADTKEQLGGYYLLACKTDAEAIDWAAQCSAAPTGAVEVRPVWKMG